MTTQLGSHASVHAAGELLPHEAHELLAALAPVFGALALGVLAATLLRRRRLHWTWAPFALMLALVCAPLLGPAGPVALLATLAATVRGRRRHRDDLEAGADLGRRARARFSPLDAGRRLAGRIAEARRSRAAWPRPGGAGPQAPALTRPGSLLLGRDPHGRAVRIPFGREVAGHTLVVGATGSGKTVTQTLMARAAIEDGRAVVVIDPKGDEAMRRELAGAAARASRRFVEWTPSGPSSYNPYARGGETEIADRLLAGEHFTEPHYLRQAQRYLGHAIRALRATGRDVSLATVVELLDPQALESLLRETGPADAARGHAYLDSLTSRQLRDLAGIRDRLAILAESEVGRWLGASSRSFDLLSACRGGSVVLFRLEADSRPLIAQMLGAAIVQDLQSTVAALQRSPAPTLVVIDEFSALGARHVTALFGRARSAGVSLLLGTQEMADLRLPGSERLLEQVMGNLSLLVAHRQVVPASAELISRLAGERGCWRVSWGSGGRTTRTRTSEPMLDPGLLAEMPPGCGVLIGFGAARAVSVVEVRARGGVRR
jgi:hypothetical protein